MLFVILHEFVCVLAHFKEIRFFLSHLDFSAAVGAFAVDQLTFSPEGFARSAIPALVFAFIDIALFKQSFEYFLNLFFVIFVGRADEFVVAGIHQIPYPLYLRRRLVDILFGTYARRLSLLLYLLAVLVGARLQTDVVTLFTLETRQKVGEDDLVGIAYMRLCRSVSYRCSDVVFFFHYTPL